MQADLEKDKDAARKRHEDYKDKGHGVRLAKNKKLEELQKIFASRDVQYPLLKLIICKKAILKGETEEKIIYYDGIEEFSAHVTIRLNELTPGEYYVMFLADFKKDDRFRRLNLSLYSKFC